MNRIDDLRAEVGREVLNKLTDDNLDKIKDLIECSGDVELYKSFFPVAIKALCARQSISKISEYESENS